MDVRNTIARHNQDQRTNEKQVTKSCKVNTQSHVTRTRTSGAGHVIAHEYGALTAGVS